MCHIKGTFTAQCNNCFLLLVYTINLSLSTYLVDPPQMGTFYMKHAFSLIFPLFKQRKVQGKNVISCKIGKSKDFLHISKKVTFLALFLFTCVPRVRIESFRLECLLRISISE